MHMFSHCIIISTQGECFCCKEMPQILNKLTEMENIVDCITVQPGFSPVCLTAGCIFSSVLQFH